MTTNKGKMVQRAFDAVKTNPIASAMVAFTGLVTLLVSTMTASGQLDSMVMSEEEHMLDIRPLAHNVASMQQWNRCLRLELRLESLEDRKWKLEQAVTPADVLRDASKDISLVQRKYRALGCDTVLSS